MKKILFLIMVILLSLSFKADAATRYVRTDGSNGTNCTGLGDAAYDGSGTGEACGLNHPNWVFPPRNESTTRQAVSGDTVVIRTGDYRIGCQNASSCKDSNVNLTQNSFCNPSWSYDCYMDTIPSNITIIGCTTSGCTTLADRPELWGAGRATHIINMVGQNTVTIKDIVIRDRETCGLGNSVLGCGSADSSELSGRDGIVWTGSDSVTLTNVDIIGMMRYAIYGTASNSTIDGASRIEYNAVGGVDMDTCGNDGTCGLSSGQTFTIGTDANNNPNKMVSISWNGCVENYSTGTAANDGCYNGNNGGFGDGFGGSTTSGDWVFNFVKFNANTSDGLDMKYSSKTGASVSIKNSIFSSNAGNQFKTAGTATIYNTFIEANCDFFVGKAYKLSGLADCNALGDAFNVNFSEDGQIVKFYGNTIVDMSGNVAFSVVPRGTCTNNTLDIKNNIIQSNGRYSGLGGGSPGFSYIDSGCTNTTITQTQSNIDGFSSNPSGTGNVFTDPLLSGTITGVTQAVKLASGSPARDIADEGATGQPSTDFNIFARGGSWDSGALEYLSSYGGGASCGNNTTEVGETCDGTDLNSETCVTQGFTSGTLACQGDCSDYDTSSCVTDLCGNGNIDPTEDCDTSGPNLNGATCASLGFSADPADDLLACTALTCLFNTGSCTAIACQDGYREGSEGCDDGNATEGDGCSSLCETENASYELFLNYTDTDPNSRTTVATHTVTVNGVGRNEGANLKKDFGAANFGDFVHRFKFTQDSCQDGGSATITYDAGSETTQSAASSVTFSHTVASGSNRLLIVSITREEIGTDRTISSVTYDSVAMTVGTSTQTGDTDNKVDVYYLLAPNVGAANVVITYSGAVGSTAATADSWTNVAQQAPEVVHTSVNATNNFVTSTDNSLSVNSLVAAISTATLTPVEIEAHNFANTGEHMMGVSYKIVGTAGSTSMSWTVSSGNYATTIVVFAPANTGGANSGIFGAWSVASASYADIKAQETASDGMFLYLSCKSSVAENIWNLVGADVSSTPDTYTDSDSSLVRYIEVERSGTTVTAKIYSDASFSTLLDTLSTTTTATTHRYLMAGSTYDDSISGTSFSGSVGNVDLTATAAPPATPAIESIRINGQTITGGNWP